jgi:small subunit ribosomal protein S9
VGDDERREDETPAEEQPAGDAPADESADDAAADAPEAEAPEPAAEEAPAAEAPEAAAEESEEAEEKPSEGKKTDLPPGAELDPIALEPERELSAEEKARLEAEEEERRRREAAEEEGDEPVARQPKVQLSEETRIQATGKRKSSIARVIVVPGNGTFEVNSRPIDEYFPRHAHQTAAKQPLVTAGYEGTVDVRVRVHGGGVSGQAGAVRHGVARALVEIDPELRPELKRRGLLTRDAREKERRKAGLKKARKRPQFSKR